MTLAIFNVSVEIHVVKYNLYKKHSYSEICSLANFNIFMGILLILNVLLQSRFDIISGISFLVQGNIRNDSLQTSVKKLSKDFKSDFILDWKIE